MYRGILPSIGSRLKQQLLLHHQLQWKFSGGASSPNTDDVIQCHQGYLGLGGDTLYEKKSLPTHTLIASVLIY